ncbi:2-phospho-L-lactate guanylyltransferase [Micromonospora zhanjiangensis]|uniref:Phosphoenolpyruvate guanylyltransferase n=1 Tax=Micromonospora zhanjiangensis TaxID=1522057 RepID=A0ABV8KG29_9ACTN
MGEQNWTVLVPVKRLDVAKSRLRGTLDDVPHQALALALAQDTVAAARACPQVAAVLVLTDDAEATEALSALGAQVHADPPGGGLNETFTLGGSLVTDGPVAALTADLPALRPLELAAALRAAADGPAGVRRFVTDTPGTGTVLLTAPEGVPLEPRFGEDSATAHAESGAVALAGPWPTLRRDVDVPADLAAAAVLGLGRHTAALARRLAPVRAVDH